MNFKAYFNVSNLHPGIDAIYDIDQKTGNRIDVINVGVHNPEIIIRGYLDAINLIVMNAEQNNYVNLDSLLFPIIFLCVSIIEFCLKIILNKLNDHRESGCQFMSTYINSDKNHKVKNLLNNLKKIYIKNKNLPPQHIFQNLDLLEHLVNEFEKNGIESVSMRYIGDHKNTPYSLYKKGITCDFKSLHKDVQQIADSTLNYIGSLEFIFCNTGEYTRTRLMKLKKIYTLTQKLEILTRGYREIYFLSREQRKKIKLENGEDPDVYTAADVDFTLLNHSNYYNFDCFSTADLDLLLLGVYFYFYPCEPLPSLDDIKGRPTEQKIQKINTNIININNGLENLKKHIERVRNVLHDTPPDFDAV